MNFLWIVIGVIVGSIIALIISITIYELYIKPDSYECISNVCVATRNGPYETKEICAVDGCGESFQCSLNQTASQVSQVSSDLHVSPLPVSLDNVEESNELNNTSSQNTRSQNHQTFHSTHF